MALTREAFFAAAPPLRSEEVAVPALGATVIVREPTAGERDRFEVAQARDPGRDFRARLAIAAVRDEAGAPLFTDADTAALSALPPEALQPIVEAALRLMKFAADDVRELEKN